MSSWVDLLMCRNFEYYVIFIMNFLFVHFLLKKESLIGQLFFVGAIGKQKQIFVLQNSKFCQISKSMDDIHTYDINV